MSSYQKNWRPGARKRLTSSLGREAILWRFLGALKKQSLLGFVLRGVALIGGAGMIIGVGAFVYYSKDLPDPDKLSSRIVAESTKIYDRNGELLYDIFGEAKRTLISFEEMPQHIKQATIAIEDKDFYKHKGISLGRILYSAAFDLVTLSKSQGASTITQQLIRNAFLTKEKRISRKIKEIVLAVQIERKYSKDEILKLYLNEVPYGSNAYGIQAAAQTFFNKSAKDLTLAESAYLAAMPQAPTLLSPYGPNRDRLEARKNTVLKLMEEQGYVSAEQAKVAREEKVAFSPVRNSIKAPHFVLYVQDMLAQKYGEKTLQEGGLQVTTTLDLKLQKFAEEAIAEVGEKNEKNFRAKNAALTAIDPTTGQIVAMVGSRNFFDEKNDGQVNVTLRPRQPGSSFKPYVYATAFKKDFAPATMLMDVVTNFGTFGGQSYIPHNYNGKNYGPVSMRQALAGSLNIPAVKTILLVGVKASIDTARDLGITTLQDEDRYGPALVLGGGEVKLLDHVSAFGTFGNGGVRKPPTPILKITKSGGEILEEYQDKTGQQVIDPQVAYLITSILSDNGARAFVFGSRNSLTLGSRPVAAKTGTTQEFHDAWTVGYTPQLSAGVWVGNNDNAAMKPGADGSVVAAPIWNAFMKKTLEGQPVKEFARPNGIQQIEVDSVSGKLPTEFTPSTKSDLFTSFALPNKPDDLHFPIKIDRLTGQPATAETPPENLEIRVYTIFRSERPEDPRWEEPVRAWAIASGYSYPDLPADYANTTEQSITSTDRQIHVVIAEPDEDETITSLPVKITAQASAPANTPIKNLTLFFDGKQIFSTSSAAASFFYADPQPDGPHLIRVRAETTAGTNTEVTRRVIYQRGTALVLRAPTEGLRLAFPVAIHASAGSEVTAVAFYYQRTDSNPRRIPGTVAKTDTEATNEFQLTWAAVDKPRAGTYQLYAQTPEGHKSQIVTVVVP